MTYTEEEILNRIDDPPQCKYQWIDLGDPEEFGGGCDEDEWNPFSGYCWVHDRTYE